MDDGPPRFQQGSTCPAVLRNVLTATCDFAYETVTLYGPSFQIILLSLMVGFIARPTTPTKPKLCWFRLFPVRSPLLWESRLISLPRGTEMFHFPRFALLSELAAYRNVKRYRNINLFPIDYASQPRLRGRLTLRRLTLRRNPWSSGGDVFHTPYRYSRQHSHF